MYSLVTHSFNPSYASAPGLTRRFSTNQIALRGGADFGMRMRDESGNIIEEDEEEEGEEVVDPKNLVCVRACLCA